MVARLSGMDAVALHTETTTTPAHVVAVIIIEASDRLSHERLHELVASSLPRVARFRSRLVSKPFGLGQPVWAELKNFDPSRQLHRVAVPPPGGPEEFADLIAKLTTRPLNRNLQLWQAWSIEGLQGGRWALALKMSQAMTDGAAGLPSILARLLTVSPDDDPTANLPAEPSLGTLPSTLDLVADTAIELAENQVRGAALIGGALPGVLRSAVTRLRRGGGRQHNRVPVPRTVFNEPLTEQRAVAFASIPLVDMKSVKNAFDVSINDVFLAGCTLSLRNWLQRHDAVPDYPLVM